MLVTWLTIPPHPITTSEERYPTTISPPCLRQEHFPFVRECQSETDGILYGGKGRCKKHPDRDDPSFFFSFFLTISRNIEFSKLFIYKRVIIAKWTNIVSKMIKKKLLHQQYRTEQYDLFFLILWLNLFLRSSSGKWSKKCRTSSFRRQFNQQILGGQYNCF